MTIPLDYWETIPPWNNEGKDKRFEIMADAYSGRIPVTRIEDWRDFTSLLEDDFFNCAGTELVFRGHRRYDWAMTPTLGRLVPSGIVTERLADDQLTLFRQAIRGRITDHSLLVAGEQDEELWSIGQHHGLMTPLLDWTYSPYVALFFAFSKEDKNDEKDNPYRVVYVLNKSFVADECSDIKVFEPKKDDHGRLVSQAGLFTFSPIDATIENKLVDILTSDEFKGGEMRKAFEEDEAEVLAKYICKIYIKNEDQQGCLKHLRRMNVHHASLFPDLIGASDYCNIFMAEKERERLLAEQNKSVAPVSEAADDKQEAETIEFDADHQDINNLIYLLKKPEESHEVEPGRIQLIAEELFKAISKNKLVDWQTRETIQAEIRNTTRVLLRKYGYPVTARDYIIENVLDVETEMKDEQGEAANE